MREAEQAERAEYGGHMAMGQRACDGEGLVGTDQNLALEEAAEGVNPRRWPVGEIGDGAFANLRAVANGLAEEDGGRGVAIRDALHVHGNMLPQKMR